MKRMIIMIFLLICFNLFCFNIQEISQFNQTESYITYDDTYAVKDDYLYSTTIRGFQIHQILTDSLELVNDFNLEKHTYHLKIKDDFLFVSCGIDRLYKFDISNVTEPVLIDSIEMLGAYVFFFNNEFLYVNEHTITGWKIHIFDYFTLEEINCYNVPHTVSALKKIAENVARVSIFDHLYIYDISDPYSIEFIGYDETNEHSNPKVQLLPDSLLAVGSHLGKFEIYDISQPTDWQLITFIGYDGMCFNIINNRLIIKGYRTLYLFDISDLSEPILLDSTSIASYDMFRNLKAFGNNIFAGTYAGKLIYYKLSDDHFHVNQTISNGGRLSSMKKHQENLYILSLLEGIFHWDISDIANPVYQNNYLSTKFGFSMFKAQNILIVYGQDFEMLTTINTVFRINEYGELDELDTLYFENSNVERLHYHPEYGFFMITGTTLYIYHLDENDELQESFTMEVPEILFSEFIFNGNIAYVIGYHQMYVLTNIDEPNLITVSNTIIIDDYEALLSYGFFRNYLFIGSEDYFFPCKVFDISQPDNPILFTEIDDCGLVAIDEENEILFSGFDETYAYDISNIESGIAPQIYQFPIWSLNEELITFNQNNQSCLSILDRNSCRIFEYDTTSYSEETLIEIKPAMKNYPNPFNPETIISFSIPNQSNVELTVFNFKGQKVKQLISDQLTSGAHSVIWDGRDDSNLPVGSGIYFYKLEAGNYQQVRKMILMK